MTALYIIGSIAAIFVLLFLSSISVHCVIDDEINVKLGFLFFRKRFNPSDKQEDDSKKTEKSQTKNKNYVKRLIEEKGVASALSELLGIAKIILKKIGTAAGHIRVKRFDMLVTAASDDPAKTAVEYGTLCAAVFPALSFFQNLLKWNENKTHVSVKSDFCSDKSTLYIDMKLKLRLWFIAKAAVGVFWILIKQKLQEATANSRSLKINTANNKSQVSDK